MKTHDALSVMYALWQGGLDMQYLSSRYDKGKLAVQSLMERRHQMLSVSRLTLGQGEVVQKQAALGKNAFLGVQCFA